MREWGLYVSKGVKEPEPQMFAEPGLYLVKPDNTIYIGGAQLHAGGPPPHRRHHDCNPIFRGKRLSGSW